MRTSSFSCSSVPLERKKQSDKCWNSHEFEWLNMFIFPTWSLHDDCLCWGHREYIIIATSSDVLRSSVALPTQARFIDIDVNRPRRLPFILERGQLCCENRYHTLECATIVWSENSSRESTEVVWNLRSSLWWQHYSEIILLSTGISNNNGVIY